MLSASNRLTSPQDFARAIRQGSRASSRVVVVHRSLAAATGQSQPRIGLVVSKAVGNAVVRNQVKRRLRHWCRDQIAQFPADTLTVVRALPGASVVSYEELGAELNRCLTRVTAREGGKL